MSPDVVDDAQMEIAHVLFTDIVGYSKLLTDQQRELLQQLNQIIRSTEPFRSAEAAGKLVRLPTGDGMALAFFTSPDAPVRCAIEIARALRSHPRLRLRMGIDSGPVEQVSDVNDRSNVAGAGINMAQRVMDCGDAGHILLSKRVAGDLAQYSKWQPQLHDLGEVEVKHGVKIGVVNFVDGDIGNPATPEKIKRAQREQARAGRRHRAVVATLVLFAALALGALFWFSSHRAKPESTPAATSVPISSKSIAVLPFENLSAEKDDAFFADGIQDDVLTSLGKIKELTVIARGSVLPYRGEAVAGKLREIGQTLRVSHILQGSVRRLANRVVVNVQLIDARNDRQMWTERYERTITDALSLQGELAVEIARELRANLTPQEQRGFASKPTENPDAYVLYLRARELETRFLAEDADLQAAAKLYEQAIELDPKFALARARLSLVAYRLGSTPESRLRDLAQAEEALRLNPNLGEGHLALAFCYFETDKIEPALAELARAEELLPNSPEVWQQRATIYLRQGKLRERIAALQHAETLDPRDIMNGGLAHTHEDLRQWPEAIRIFERVRALVPGHPGPERGIARAEFRKSGLLAALKKKVTEVPAGTQPDLPDVLNMTRYQIALMERDYPAAERFLREIPAEALPAEHFLAHSKLMNEALLAVARGADATAIENALLAAQKETEKFLADDPANFRLHGELGLIDAFRSRKEDAIREARRWLELEKESSLEKNDAAANLALIYARTGEVDEAIKLIERLLTLPANLQLMRDSSMTQADLKWRWVWDPLRSDPRFQKILEGPEPKTIY